MQVTVYSREAMETMIRNQAFPPDTAVISFFDPAVKHIDTGYTHVDYSRVCRDVYYCEAEDLDRDYLAEKGYTYESYFPDAAKIAEFIYWAYDRRKNMICQCDYGQSRSAACAAAILEHFYHNGGNIENRHAVVEALVFNFELHERMDIQEENLQLEIDFALAV